MAISGQRLRLAVIIVTLSLHVNAIRLATRATGIVGTGIPLKDMVIIELSLSAAMSFMAMNTRGDIINDVIVFQHHRRWLSLLREHHNVNNIGRAITEHYVRSR